MSLEHRLAEVAERVGPWQSHNVRIADGLWTMSGREPVPDLRLARVVRLVSDLAPRPLEECRVLDLACEEGVFGIELARLGAEVVGVEGRAVHVERARFAAEAIGLERIEIRQGDVRKLSPARDGRFDVVLCLGLLYHLDAPDVLEFAELLGELCDGLLVLDTHVSLAPRQTVRRCGREYSGTRYLEHRPAAAAEEREGHLRASLDNTESFWLTRASLCNLLLDAGFSSVLEHAAPRAPGQPADEVMLAALKGSPDGAELPRLPERERRPVHPGQTLRGRLRRALARLR